MFVWRERSLNPLPDRRLLWLQRDRSSLPVVRFLWIFGEKKKTKNRERDRSRRSVVRLTDERSEKILIVIDHLIFITFNFYHHQNPLRLWFIDKPSYSDSSTWKSLSWNLLRNRWSWIIYVQFPLIMNTPCLRAVKNICKNVKDSRSKGRYFLYTTSDMFIYICIYLLLYLPSTSLIRFDSPVGWWWWWCRDRNKYSSPPMLVLWLFHSNQITSYTLLYLSYNG